MHKIHFYRDRQGQEPVLEYLRALHRKGDKQSRVKLNKIQDYIQMLSVYGTQVGLPYVKYIGDGLWELRPLRDRLFFVAWAQGSYVLLHSFMKKSTKTPAREIEAARRAWVDLLEREGKNEE